jgi:putative membrane protein
MKNLIYTLSVMTVVFAISACADARRPKNYNQLIDEGSVVFIRQGLADGQAELEASKLAQATSKSSRVVNLANMVVKDHLTITDELEKIAINNKVRGGDSLSAERAENLNVLKKLSGAEFDKAYALMMVKSHQSAVKSFKTASTDRIEEIQKFAKLTLPILRTHLDSAEAVYADLR